MSNSTYDNARKAFYERRKSLSNHEFDDYDCRHTDDLNDDDDADCFCD